MTAFVIPFAIPFIFKIQHLMFDTQFTFVCVHHFEMIWFG